MNLSFFRDCVIRAWERKRAMILIAAFFLIGILLGIIFANTPTFYEYQLNLCDRFLYHVCYSDRSVFIIFLERTAGSAVLLAITCFSGIHIVGLVVPPAVLFYRSYTFGGCIAILFSVYGVSGAIVALVLFLPIHLLTDAVLVASTAISCGRARCFRFARQDFLELLFDFLALFILIVAVYLLEAILLLAIFHPLGNLI